MVGISCSRDSSTQPDRASMTDLRRGTYEKKGSTWLGMTMTLSGEYNSLTF